MRGERFSVRLPSRTVPICVSEPTGAAKPRRTNSTPAINVVLTAPIPGVSTPNLPFGGAILTGLRIHFPLFAIVDREKFPHGRRQRDADCARRNIMREARKFCKSKRGRQRAMLLFPDRASFRRSPE